MIILLIGVACVGKSSVGKKLAEDIGFTFFDLDLEIEKYYGDSISRLKAKALTPYSWRLEGKVVLDRILNRNKHGNIVVALPPSGLRDAYYRVIKKFLTAVIVLHDAPENILKRVVFFDDDSRPIDVILDDHDKKYVLSEIKKDMTYYKRSYARARYHVDITGLDVAQTAAKISELLGIPTVPKTAEPHGETTATKRLSEPNVPHTNRTGKRDYLHVGKTKRCSSG